MAEITPDMFETFGSPGLRRAKGFIHEERHPNLQGTYAARTYREMGDNDAVIGAVLYVIEMLCRSVEWRTEPADTSVEAGEVSEFVDSCREDMSHTWEHFISEVLSCLQYGWAYHEIVYKIRRGPDEEDGQYRSKYSDGRIGWRKLDPRAQLSLLRWEYDDEQSLRGLWQLPQDIYKQCFVPIEKALLFRVKAPLNNPEGRSLLRNAYRSWHFVKRLEEIEAIGIARDLAGMPVAKVPPEALGAGATPTQTQIVNNLKTLVSQINRNEREGLVLPAEEIPGPGGTTLKTGYSFSLLTTGGSRQIQPDVAIRRHQSRIAMTLLCEWLMLGADKTGSYALASTKTDLFAAGLKTILKSISDVLNNYAIPRLMTVNAYPQALWPKFVHGDVGDVDIAAVATAINELCGVGVLVPDDKLERKLREMLGLPQRDLDTHSAAPIAPQQQPPSAAPAPT